MSDTYGDQNSLEEIRAAVVERLRARRSGIVQAIYACIQDAVPDPVGSKSPEYQTGVRAAVMAFVDYCLEGIKVGPDWSGPIPPEVAAQARRAARYGVSLSTILCRCFTGHGRLGEFIAEEANGVSSSDSALHHLRRTQETLLERLTSAIEHEYNQEREQVARSPEQRRARLVRRLLVDEPVDPAELAELDYDIHAGWHLGVIAAGAGAEAALRRLKTGLGRHLLLVSCGEGTAWGWLGGQRRFEVADIERLSTNGHVGVSFAIGELGPGISGWRLTHHQAQAAFAVAMRKSQRFTRYADSPLLAAALQNDTLAISLKEMYLAPLGTRRDARGAERRQTLRAYIDAQCNATSAASPLDVGRHTVESRLRAIEKLLGRPPRTCLAELDVALRLEELDDVASDELQAKR